MRRKSNKRARRGAIITRGRLSRWQMEKRWQRIAISSGCVIIAIVLAVFGYGYYDAEVKPYHQMVLKVNDASFNMDYYIQMLRLSGIRNTDDLSQQQYIAQHALDTIKNNELTRQLASHLGLLVTEEEVEEEIQEQFPPPQESGKDTKETLQSISYEEYLEKMGVPEALFQRQVSVSLLQNKMREHVGKKEIPREATHTHVKGILIEDEESLKEVQERLKSGEDFSVLAKEFSKHPSGKDGGELGWMPREIMVREYPKKFVDTAFQLAPGKVSEPVEIEAEDRERSYWLIKVLDRENRPLEDSDKRTLRNQAFNEWFSEQSQQFTIEEHLGPDLEEWAIEKAIE